MSNVYLFALSGVNSAQQAQLRAARTISISYEKPAPPQGYGPPPRDRVEITGGQGQAKPATYAPPAQASALPSGSGGKFESGIGQLLVARQAIAANARMLEADARTQQTLLDVTA